MLRTGAHISIRCAMAVRSGSMASGSADVTLHPAFRPIVTLRARLYDMAHEARHSAAMSYVDDASGERCNLALKLPKTQQDWHEQARLRRCAAQRGRRRGGARR